MPASVTATSNWRNENWKNRRRLRRCHSANAMTLPIASIATGQIGDLVGPNTGDLTTVSTVDPIKVYYKVTEQAYINFTKLFATERDRYERLGKLEIELILADGAAYASKGRI